VKLVPDRATGVPTGPDGGVKPTIVGGDEATPVTVRLIGVVCVIPPDVPVTVTVAIPSVAVALAVSVKRLVLVVLLGLNDAVTPLGNPDAAKLTLPVKLPTSPTVIVLVPLLPRAMLKVLGAAVSVKVDAAVTVRLIVAVCVNFPDVPVTVTVEVPVVAELLAVSVKMLVLVVLLGLNEAVTPLGNPDAAKLTLPMNPPTSPTAIVLVPLLPLATLKVLGAAVSVKVPVPVSEISSGLGLALLVTVSAPTTGPTMVGANWTSIVQLLPASTALPVKQVVPLGWIWKSPVGTTLLNVTELALLLVIFTDFAALVEPAACDKKVRLAGATVISASEVPVRLTSCGLLLLLGVKTTAADPSMEPIKVGLNVISKVHLAAAASDDGQVLLRIE